MQRSHRLTRSAALGTHRRGDKACEVVAAMGAVAGLLPQTAPSGVQQSSEHPDQCPPEDGVEGESVPEDVRRQLRRAELAPIWPPLPFLDVRAVLAEPCSVRHAPKWQSIGPRFHPGIRLTWTARCIAVREVPGPGVDAPLRSRPSRWGRAWPFLSGNVRLVPDGFLRGNPRAPREQQRSNRARHKAKRGYGDRPSLEAWSHHFHSSKHTGAGSPAMVFGRAANPFLRTSMLHRRPNPCAHQRGGLSISPGHAFADAAPGRPPWQPTQPLPLRPPDHAIQTPHPRCTARSPTPPTTVPGTA